MVSRPARFMERIADVEPLVDASQTGPMLCCTATKSCMSTSPAFGAGNAPLPRSSESVPQEGPLDGAAVMVDSDSRGSAVRTLSWLERLPPISEIRLARRSCLLSRPHVALLCAFMLPMRGRIGDAFDFD